MVENKTRTTPLGLIGVGLMGQVFARRWIDAGFSVLGYDVDAAKGAQLTAIGGEAAGSIADVAKRCDIIMVVVFSVDQVEDVIENQIIPAVGEASGKIVLCASTCDPDRLAALGARIAKRGIRFLETPVSGTSAQVASGDGAGLIGGDEQLAAEIHPVLAALYPRIFHIGGHGDGSRAKLAINLILGINRTALAEGLVFAERIGLDPAKFFPVAKESAAYSRVMEGKGPKMLARDFSPEGMIQISLKDANLMRAQAQKAGQQMPLLEAYRDILQGCSDRGQERLDNSSVIEEIRRRFV
jgi:3-hydroxyisobutyrate dehydrogenase-like beta-hydroxyacid dehydrogenase